MRGFIIVFLLFFVQFGISQKLVEKTVLNPKTRAIQIDASKCFQLVVNTHKSNILKVEATIAGEDAKDLVIKMEEDGQNIGVSADYLPNFKEPKYKFSALKVISIALHVTLPEYMTASIDGTNTNVVARGRYTDLSITLSDGNCSLHNISEKIRVKTQTGEIMVTGAKGVVTAESTYGKVKKGHVPSGDENFLLQSVEGTILVNTNNG